MATMRDDDLERATAQAMEDEERDTATEQAMDDESLASATGRALEDEEQPLPSEIWARNAQNRIFAANDAPLAGDADGLGVVFGASGRARPAPRTSIPLGSMSGPESEDRARVMREALEAIRGTRTTPAATPDASSVTAGDEDAPIGVSGGPRDNAQNGKVTRSRIGLAESAPKMPSRGGTAGIDAGLTRESGEFPPLGEEPVDDEHPVWTWSKPVLNEWLKQANSKRRSRIANGEPEPEEASAALRDALDAIRGTRADASVTPDVSSVTAGVADEGGLSQRPKAYDGAQTMRPTYRLPGAEAAHDAELRANDPGLKRNPGLFDMGFKMGKGGISEGASGRTPLGGLSSADGKEDGLGADDPEWHKANDSRTDSLIARARAKSEKPLVAAVTAAAKPSAAPAKPSTLQSFFGDKEDNNPSWIARRGAEWNTIGSDRKPDYGVADEMDARRAKVAADRKAAMAAERQRGLDASLMRLRELQGRAAESTAEKNSRAPAVDPTTGARLAKLEAETELAKKRAEAVERGPVGRTPVGRTGGSGRTAGGVTPTMKPLTQGQFDNQVKSLSERMAKIAPMYDAMAQFEQDYPGILGGKAPNNVEMTPMERLFAEHGLGSWNSADKQMYYSMQRNFRDIVEKARTGATANSNEQAAYNRILGMDLLANPALFPKAVDMFKQANHTMASTIASGYSPDVLNTYEGPDYGAGGWKHKPSPRSPLFMGRQAEVVAPVAKTAPTSGKIRMRSPSGKTASVDPDGVEDAIAHGWTRI